MHLPEQTFSAIAALMNKAKVEIGRKNYSAALAFYQKAEAAFPQPVQDYTGACFLWYSMAQVHLVLLEEVKALTYNSKALACLDGFNDAKVYYQAGLLLLRIGEIEKAIENLKKAFILGGKPVFTDALPSENTFFINHIFQLPENA